MQGKNKKESNLKWPIEAFFLTFILSGVVSFISNNKIEKLNIYVSIIILFIVVFIGIIFDVIGIAVTVAEEGNFHAKATKKAKGAKTSIKLIKNASKIANICADVIGDICRSCKWKYKCFNFIKTCKCIQCFIKFSICNKRSCCSTNSKWKSFWKKFCSKKLN